MATTPCFDKNNTISSISQSILNRFACNTHIATHTQGHIYCTRHTHTHTHRDTTHMDKHTAQHTQGHTYCTTHRNTHIHAYCNTHTGKQHTQGHAYCRTHTYCRTQRDTNIAQHTQGHVHRYTQQQIKAKHLWWVHSQVNFTEGNLRFCFNLSVNFFNLDYFNWCKDVWEQSEGCPRSSRRGGKGKNQSNSSEYVDIW